MTLDLAIIMGSTYTSIFLSGHGVVLREPTIAAFSAGSKKVKAAGSAAFMMMGKTVEGTALIAPVKNGIVCEPRIAAQLLKEFIQRLYPATYILRPKVNAVVAIPSGLKKQDCEMYYEVLSSAGVSGNIYLVPKIMMAAVGADLPVSSAQSSMIASLGGGTTEIGVVALSGIISSGTWGITIGGDMMDRALCDYIAGKYNLKISLSIAKKLKETIGSLYENDISFMQAKGLDITSKMPATTTVHASDIMEVIAPYFLRIADVIETAINGCNPEISSDILRNGIFLCGGNANIIGLKELLAKKLELKINVVNSPDLAAVIGGGKLLLNRELLEDILS